MKYKWLNAQNNESLIVFFNGWGMDESIVKHLEFDNFDVLMFYDYNNLDLKFNLQTLENYNNKYLIAWSMGVMVASLFKILYNSKTAVNGTLKPIDDKYGIPEKIYDLTIKGFNTKSANLFIQKMYNNTTGIPTINRDLENIKNELSALKNYNADIKFSYNKFIISDNDKIIPTRNQVNFWGQKPNIKEGHCPFNSFHKWSNLL